MMLLAMLRFYAAGLSGARLAVAGCCKNRLNFSRLRARDASAGRAMLVVVAVAVALHVAARLCFKVWRGGGGDGWCEDNESDGRTKAESAL